MLRMSVDQFFPGSEVPMELSGSTMSGLIVLPLMLGRNKIV